MGEALADSLPVLVVDQSLADTTLSEAQPVSDPPHAANGSGQEGQRYEYGRLLGTGAMGAVHLVRDRETSERLALKRLFRMDAATSLRLKREFRALADVSHRNLVKLYELGQDDDGWFLTMEFVDGEELGNYLGLKDRTRSTDRTAKDWWRRAEKAFHQLAAGVHALHSAGLLHRDLKPKNVMVADGRVVVLDFGLVRELDGDAAKLTDEGAIAGTPAYMAPEQVLAQPLTEASDWYAFGAMLYEALTGELPFGGRSFEIMQAKLACTPRRVRELEPGVPDHLDALCAELLAYDPGARPAGIDICRRLDVVRRQPAAEHDGSPQTGETSLVPETQTRDTSPFFGRTAELAALWRALENADEGRAAVVQVRGMSGCGKSALVEHFLDQVEREPSGAKASTALLLRGRCYEREAMPFKALDSVIDSLGRYLSQLSDVEVGHLLPTDIDVLAQVFPVLSRLRPVQELVARRPARGGAVDNRRRAEDALRELFRRLTERGAVVVWIDDLQWGDLDSARILKGWLQHADDLPLMLVLSHRSDETDTSECLKLLSVGGDDQMTAPTAILELDALEVADLEALCRQRLAGVAADRPTLVSRIAAESQGSPFLAEQLTTLAATKLARGDADIDSISIRHLVEQTTSMVDEGARQLLAVLAVAGRPMVPKLALHAAGLRRGGREVVHGLRRLQLVRARDVGTERLIEVYHDRVREGVQRLLSAEQSQRIHASLLAALEYSGRADPDWLHALALGAGERGAALRYGMAAAARASATLAFERSAKLYERCLELTDASHAERAELLDKLASALDLCGRGSEAADAYLRAAELTEGDAAARRMRLATSHLLRSGRFEEGEALLQRVLRQIDLEVPGDPRGVLRSLVWARWKRKLRGLGFPRKSEDEVPAVLLERIDMLDALRMDTSSMDPLRSALFLEQELRLALDAGEPVRVLIAVSGLALAVARAGSARGRREAEELLARADSLAEGVDAPVGRGALCLARASVNLSWGRLREALEPAAEAEQIYRSLPEGGMRGGYHERVMAASMRAGALIELGEMHTVVRDLKVTLRETEAAGNVAGLLHLSVARTSMEEFEGRAPASVERLETERRQLPQSDYGLYHTLHLLGVCHAACASGQAAWGVALMEEDWPRFLRSPLRRSAYLEGIVLRARHDLLMNHHAATGGRSELPQRVRRELCAMSRRVALAAPSRSPILARLALAEGDPQRARQLLETALGEVTNPLYNARHRVALGWLTAGAEGAALREQGERELSTRGIANAHAYVRGWYPELYEAR